jgi:hypothetical protein
LPTLEQRRREGSYQNKKENHEIGNKMDQRIVPVPVEIGEAGASG